MGTEQAPKRDTRFKPGQSGNPKGRPRKERRAIAARQIWIDYLSVLERPVTIQLNGKKKTVPIDIAIFEQLATKAAQGDMRAIKTVIEYRREFVREHEATQCQLAELLVQVEKAYERDPASFDDMDLASMHEMRRRVYNPFLFE